MRKVRRVQRGIRGNLSLSFFPVAAVDRGLVAVNTLMFGFKWQAPSLPTLMMTEGQKDCVWDKRRESASFSFQRYDTCCSESENFFTLSWFLSLLWFLFSFEHSKAIESIGVMDILCIRAMFPSWCWIVMAPWGVSTSAAVWWSLFSWSF
jgi:hypothetical protein